MNDNINLHKTFVDVVNQNRTKILDQYVTNLRNQNKQTIQEDRLTLLVRASSLLDILIDYLITNHMNRLNEFFNSYTKKLLGLGYQVEEINRMYDLLEKEVMVVFETYLSENSNFNVSLRSIRSALQLAKILTVNMHLANVSTNINNRNSGNLSNNSARFTKTKFEEKSATSVSNSVLVKDNLPRNKQNQYDNPSYSESGNQKATRPGMKLGYLVWPLQAIPQTSPTEYKAFLGDYTGIQVLLVDKEEYYAPPPHFNSNIVSCYIRQIGPITLAYPL